MMAVVALKLMVKLKARAIYFAKMILPAGNMVSIVSIVPSSISGLIRLLDKLMKASGMLMTAKIMPKDWMSS
jgi:hypothetical protein